LHFTIFLYIARFLVIVSALLGKDRQLIAKNRCPPLNDVKSGRKMKVIAKCYCFVSKNHYICRVLETKRIRNGLSDIQGTDVPDGLFQHQSGAVMGE
jgi:hypothetical protein